MIYSTPPPTPLIGNIQSERTTRDSAAQSTTPGKRKRRSGQIKFRVAIDATECSVQ